MKSSSRFVSWCDKLQLLIKATAYEKWGSRGLGEFWSNLEGMSECGFVSIERVFEELKARRG